jgi:hypothetical protein
MLGRFDEAQKNVDAARAAADRNPSSRPIRDGYLGMRARYILESGRWEALPLPAEEAAPADAAGHAGMPGMAMAPASGGVSEGAATWIYIVGVSGARRGDLATADAALARLTAIRERVARGTDTYAVRPHAIREKQLGAIIASVRGQKAQAVTLAREASTIEGGMAAPSGPPEPIKPSFELYAEMLADNGQYADAVKAFEQALLRTPNRTPSVRGLAAARARVTPATTAAPRQ